MWALNGHYMNHGLASLMNRRAIFEKIMINLYSMSTISLLSIINIGNSPFLGNFMVNKMKISFQVWNSSTNAKDLCGFTICSKSLAIKTSIIVNVISYHSSHMPFNFHKLKNLKWNCVPFMLQGDLPQSIE